MIDKAALDRYITAEPDDIYSTWVEFVFDSISGEFYNMWYYFLDASDVCNRWLRKLFNKDTDPEIAAEIIERAHKLYINR